MKTRTLVSVFLTFGYLLALNTGAAEGDPDADTTDDGLVSFEKNAGIDYDLDGDVDGDDLAKAAQNPVADLISVPFQQNFNWTKNNDFIWLMNVQPVIPFKVSEKWNLISRTIIPVYALGNAPVGVDSVGMADINASFFFSPSKPSKFIWGAGPSLQFPTATDPAIASGKWSAGPTAVALYMTGPWVGGGLVNNIWSYAGWGDRDVNQMLVQPFVNYNLKGGWYLVTAPIILSNWEAPSGEGWSVPVGGGFGRVFPIGKQPINVNLQGYYNVEHPTLGPEWSIRLQIQLLFPK